MNGRSCAQALFAAEQTDSPIQTEQQLFRPRSLFSNCDDSKLAVSPSSPMRMKSAQRTRRFSDQDAPQPEVGEAQPTSPKSRRIS
jgi:hypothetical protein